VALGVAVFGVELSETEALAGPGIVLEAEVLEVPEEPSIVPGPSSGVPIKVRRGCETVTGERDKGEDSHHQWHMIC
jgi:hypothetical protein